MPAIIRFIRGCRRHRMWLLAALVALAVIPVFAEFRIGVKRNSSDVTITFDSEQGVTYGLERRTNLTDSAWQTVPGASGFTPVSNGPAQLVDFGASTTQNQTYYRVQATRAVFVDTAGGNDSNPGTGTSPKKTITSGIAAAAATLPKSDVHVSKGIYNEQVTLSNGVSLYGGFDAAAGWSRSSNNVTTIASPTPVGILGSGLRAGLTVDQFHVAAANAAGNALNGDGLSSYGVVILNSTGGVTLSGMSITAGNGTMGLAGVAGAPGGRGTNGGNASGQFFGFGGSSPCGAAGGNGGFGPNDDIAGAPGLAGTNVPGGGASAPGGAGGTAGTCSATSSSNGGAAPDLSTNGSPGLSGASGTANTPLGFVNALTLYLPSSGGDGSNGKAGGGGGGGGSGGGTAHGHNLVCSDCVPHWGGGGGGGGGGGCGGSGGQGGRGGGGSFAVFILDSIVTIESSKLTAGNSGDGGKGGDGGAGGPGGGGGIGAAGQSHSDCTTRSGGRGANGSTGGAGGTGGGGAGGAGGPSIGVFYRGASPNINGLTYTAGLAGQGGAGGQGISQAPQGPSGTSGMIVSSN